MESDHGTCKASKFTSEDIISRMPENIISNILDRLPIQEAVRTGILSRSWRFKWTMLSQLVFDDKLSEYLKRKGCKQVFYTRNLGRLLLHFRGSITKFVLYIPDREECETQYDIVEDVKQWILFLSTKGIKEFVFLNMPATPKLSTHLFSCLELKHLKLCKCMLKYVHGFHGFPNLLTLDFHNVRFESCIIREFITGCPLLESLKIDFRSTKYRCHHSGDIVELVELSKLKNLKILSLSLFMLGHKTITLSDFFRVLGVFPKLEELDFDFRRCELVIEADAGTRFSSTLPCLKTLKLNAIDFDSKFEVLCVWDLINGSPNLETLKLTVKHMNDDDDDISPCAVGSLEVDCGELQLRSVELISIQDSGFDFCFIKSLLASSPLLEKMVIHRMYDFWDMNEEAYTFATKLFELHRASTIVEIELK